MPTDWLPAGIVPFAGLSWWAIALVALIHAFGGVIRGTFGFGSNMPIVLLSTWILGPHHAILLSVLTTAVAQVQLFPQGMRTADWPVTLPLIGGLVVGIAFGTWMFTVLEPDWLTLVLGVLIAGVIAIDKFGIMERVGRRIDLRARPVTSALAVTGATIGTVSGGGALYFLIAYLKMVCASAARLRGTNVMLSAVFVVGRITALSFAGMLTPSLLVEGLLLAPAVLLASWAGSGAFRRFSTEGFFIGIQILLVLAALSLILRGLARLV